MSPSVTPGATTSMPWTCRCPSVSVPVLSVHSTSTLARPSTAGSSCTRTLLRARRTTATPKATLVSRTRPSGTIPTVPATAPDTASCQESWSRNCETNSSAAVGTIAHVTYTRMRLIPDLSSERTRVKRLACSARELAYAAWPTLVARYRPLPAATKLPESTSSPGSFTAGSDSPESSDSSTSRPAETSTSPSTTT